MDIEDYQPFPGSLKLIDVNNEYCLISTQNISKNINLGIVQVYSNRSFPAVKTALGSFIVYDEYSDNKL